MGKIPSPAPPFAPLQTAARSPRQGNGGHQPCAPSRGDPQTPSADATAGPGTPARDPGPSPARGAESAALRGRAREPVSGLRAPESQLVPKHSGDCTPRIRELRPFPRAPPRPASPVWPLFRRRSSGRGGSSKPWSSRGPRAGQKAVCSGRMSTGDWKRPAQVGDTWGQGGSPAVGV